MPDTILSFPNLLVVPINRFDLGVINGSHNGVLYSTEAGIGSAAVAYRCYARAHIGLKPLPTYASVTVKSYLGGTGAGMVTLSDIKVMSQYPDKNTLYISWAKVNASANQAIFDVDTYTDQFTSFSGSTTYTSTVAGTQTIVAWPVLTKAFWLTAFRTPGVFTQIGTQSGPWVAVPSPTVNGGASYAPGTTPPTIAPVYKTAYVSSRMVFFGMASASTLNSASLGSFDEFATSDIQNVSNITGGEFFGPENGSTIGTWGSFSEGEFWFAYQNGGGGIVYGDIQNPTLFTPLPGITGTGSAIGEAIPSPVGLVYVTDFDGAWVWNGGNTTTKISAQVQDNQLSRLANDAPPIRAANLAFDTNIGSASHGAWVNWVFFPNNWMYDSLTNSWWQVEDPAVHNFQVHAGGGLRGRHFYSSVGTAVAPTAAGTLSVPVVRWDHQNPASTYVWISNPIPSVGSSVVLGAVEICASNPTSTSATVTITPTSPPSQSLFFNQNQSQSVTFTIPPNTASYREAQQLGYNDHNMCVRVDAANSNSTNGAPTVHEINLGYEPRNN